MDTFETAMEQPEVKCFEDAFMEVLSDYVSLCLEATNGVVDVIYGFMFQNPGMLMVDAFFRKEKTICYPDDFLDDETIERFFDIGTDDLQKLIDICSAYNQKCPNEVKMVYHVQTKQFDAQFGYRDYVRKDGIDPDEVYFGWINEEKAKLN